MAVSDHDHGGEPSPDPALIATPKDFSHALVLLRRRAGLSIRDVARDLRRRPSGQVSVATLGGWFGGRHLPTPKLDPVLFELLALCGVTSPEDARKWRAALDRVRSMPGRRPRSSPSPFRGLAAYEPEDAGSFCGRETLTAELLELADRSRRLGRPVIVVGPSGSGKSSLLRAGLIPGLSRPDSPLYGTWTHVSLTPGERPVRELARRIADLVGRAPESLRQELMEHPASCGDLIRSGVRAGDGVLVVADQFEELFTSCKDDAEREAFVEALCSAAAGPPAVVAFGMRADFYLQALRIPRLVPILQDSQLVVGAMSETELRQAINRAGPAIQDHGRTGSGRGCALGTGPVDGRERRRPAARGPYGPGSGLAVEDRRRRPCGSSRHAAGGAGLLRGAQPRRADPCGHRRQPGAPVEHGRSVPSRPYRYAVRPRSGDHLAHDQLHGP
ncbi:MAG TPA: AAA family ATPase [Actinoallomurus sp.]|nr:AAA family ATPase [Actinoallomurus sp.]